MSEDQKTPNLSSSQVTKNENIFKTKESTISMEAIKALKENLWRARQRLTQFVKKIGHLKNTPIRQDVLQYCDNINNIKLNADRVLPYQKLEKLVHCRIQKMIKNRKIKQNWSQEDVLILLWVISKNFDYYQVKNIEREFDSNFWESISQMIPGVQDKDVCRFKWLSLKKNKLTENYWLDVQSIQLDKIVRQSVRQDWQQISQKLYDSLKIPNKTYRCAKQCRQHWNCYLNPNLKKGPWSEEQDLLLLTCVQNNNGLRKWTQIVNNFEGRTENALKNRFQLLLKKQKQKNKSISQFKEVQIVKYLKAKLQHQKTAGKSLNQYQIFRQYLKKNTNKQKDDKIDTKSKRNLKKLSKCQQNQQFQLYQPPRRRKQIRKQNIFLKNYHLSCKNKTKTDNKVRQNTSQDQCNKQINLQQIQMQNQQDKAQVQKKKQSSSGMQEELQQFKITKQDRSVLARVDINQSGPALLFSQLSPFKPYCIGYSSKNISKQLLFSDEQIEEQQVQFSKEKMEEEENQNKQKEKETQDKKQPSTFNQFYVKQMNYDLLRHIISSYNNKITPKINQTQESEHQICHNKNQSSSTSSKVNSSLNTTNLKDQRAFLPCILDKNKKLIPFNFNEKKQPKS